MDVYGGPQDTITEMNLSKPSNPLSHETTHHRNTKASEYMHIAADQILENKPAKRWNLERVNDASPYDHLAVSETIQAKPIEPSLTGHVLKDPCHESMPACTVVSNGLAALFSPLQAIERTKTEDSIEVGSASHPKRTALTGRAQLQDQIEKLRLGDTLPRSDARQAAEHSVQHGGQLQST